MYVEVFGSILLPVMVLSFSRLGLTRSMAYVAVMGVVSVTSSTSQTLAFAVCFAAGAVLAIFSKAILAALPASIVLIMIALAALISLTLAPADNPYWILMNTVAALALIATAARNDRWTKWLDIGALRSLGRISYSLYLIHLSVLLPVGFALWSTGFMAMVGVFFTTIIGIITTVALSIACALAIFRWVEAPSIRLGKFYSAAS